MTEAEQQAQAKPLNPWWPWLVILPCFGLWLVMRYRADAQLDTYIAGFSCDLYHLVKASLLRWASYIGVLYAVLLLLHHARQSGRFIVGLLVITSSLAIGSWSQRARQNRFLEGFRDRVLKELSLQDLRAIREAALALEKQGSQIFDVYSPSAFHQDSLDPVWLKLSEQAKISKLPQAPYPFSASLDNKTLSLCWGSSLTGHWGIVVREPVERSAHYFGILPMTEDIHLFQTSD